VPYRPHKKLLGRSMTFSEIQPEILAGDELKHCPPVDLQLSLHHKAKDYNSFNLLDQDPCMTLKFFSETKAVNTSQTNLDVSHKNLTGSRTKVDLSSHKNLTGSKTKVDLSSSKNLKAPVFNAQKSSNKVRSLNN
jgi:hypothetical protein